MSIESDVFGRSRPVPGKMAKAGFRRTKAGWTYEEAFFGGQFLACLQTGEDGRVTGRIIDTDTDEDYLPIRARAQSGGFVGSVREEYRSLLLRVREKCFAPVDFMYDQSNRIAGAIAAQYGCLPEFPWEKYPGNGTFKCGENGKWFAAILTVAYGKLAASAGKEGGDKAGDPDTIAEVINLKADPEAIPRITRGPGIFPAWHMNKKHWISVLLDDSLPDGEVMELIRESYRLVALHKAGGKVRSDAWIIPSNPKLYDIDAGFAAGDGCIEWHQHNRIKAGDEVYIYSAAPNSAIMYRCAVEAADLKYHGMFEGTKGYERCMRIRLLEKYPRERFPLSFMRENGGSPVRSARRMPARLLDAVRGTRGKRR